MEWKKKIFCVVFVSFLRELVLNKKKSFLVGENSLEASSPQQPLAAAPKGPESPARGVTVQWGVTAAWQQWSLMQMPHPHPLHTQTVPETHAECDKTALSVWLGTSSNTFYHESPLILLSACSLLFLHPVEYMVHRWFPHCIYTANTGHCEYICSDYIPFLKLEYKTKPHPLSLLDCRLARVDFWGGPFRCSHSLKDLEGWREGSSAKSTACPAEDPGLAPRAM